MSPHKTDVNQFGREFNGYYQAIIIALDVENIMLVSNIIYRIEAFADTRCAILRRNYGQIRSRFSPGYGDFSLTYQLDFDRILNMRNTLGITLNDALLMTPSKSITAVIGIPKSGDSLNDWRQNEH